MNARSTPPRRHWFLSLLFIAAMTLLSIAASAQHLPAQHLPDCVPDTVFAE